MSLLGLTLFTVALTAIVAIILAFCTTFLIKSKSPKRDKSRLEKESEEKGKTHTGRKGTKKLEKSTKAKKASNEESGSAVKTQEAPGEPSESIKTSSHADTEEDRKKEPVKEKKKSFFIFGKTSFEGCPHEFGHLRNLPKNAPIPDECFGCSQILECLGHSS